jgi:NAD(P)-dependent dehydrogenase (short-subunit alcohol dehydrogenase family)
MSDSQSFRPGAAAQTGRVALVMSGVGRLGTAVVRGLASRGYSVAIHADGPFSEARALAEEFEAAGVPSLAVTADLRDEGPIRAVVHRVADHFGRIDALATFPALARGGPLEEVTAHELRLHFDVNCVAAFVAAQEVGEFMVRQPEGGAIVLIGAAAAERPGRDAAGWLPSLAAIPTVARSLAEELSARNPRVRVNCLLPGAAAGDAAAAQVADAVLFLLENEGVTGVQLPVADSGTDTAPAG